MQRSAGSMRVTHRGTRFVSPVGSGRHPHPLARSHSRRTSAAPAAVRSALRQEPVSAIRRSARSLVAHEAPRPSTARTIRPASIHWSTPRRALSDPRSFRAVTEPR